MIEAQLKQPYLFGAEPCVADFSLYHVLWPVWKVPRRARCSRLSRRPRLSWNAWRRSATARCTEITSARRCRSRRPPSPRRSQKPEALETDGIALGEPVTVMPVDYALDPVTGELLTLHRRTEIALRRTDPRAGTVVVHFPRFGYQLAKAT